MRVPLVLYARCTSGANAAAVLRAVAEHVCPQGGAAGGATQAPRPPPSGRKDTGKVQKSPVAPSLLGRATPAVLASAIGKAMLQTPLAGRGDLSPLHPVLASDVQAWTRLPLLQTLLQAADGPARQALLARWASALLAQPATPAEEVLAAELGLPAPAKEQAAAAPVAAEGGGTDAGSASTPPPAPAQPDFDAIAARAAAMASGGRRGREGRGRSAAASFMAAPPPAALSSQGTVRDAVQRVLGRGGLASMDRPGGGGVGLAPASGDAAFLTTLAGICRFNAFQDYLLTHLGAAGHMTLVGLALLAFDEALLSALEAPLAPDAGDGEPPPHLAAASYLAQLGVCLKERSRAVSGAGLLVRLSTHTTGPAQSPEQGDTEGVEGASDAPDAAPGFLAGLGTAQRLDAGQQRRLACFVAALESHVTMSMRHMGQLAQRLAPNVPLPPASTLPVQDSYLMLAQETGAAAPASPPDIAAALVRAAQKDAAVREGMERAMQEADQPGQQPTVLQVGAQEQPAPVDAETSQAAEAEAEAAWSDFMHMLAVMQRPLLQLRSAGAACADRLLTAGCRPSLQAAKGSLPKTVATHVLTPLRLRSAHLTRVLCLELAEAVLQRTQRLASAPRDCPQALVQAVNEAVCMSGVAGRLDAALAPQLRKRHVANYRWATLGRMRGYFDADPRESTCFPFADPSRGLSAALQGAKQAAQVLAQDLAVELPQAVLGVHRPLPSPPRRSAAAYTPAAATAAAAQPRQSFLRRSFAALTSGGGGGVAGGGGAPQRLALHFDAPPPPGLFSVRLFGPLWDQPPPAPEPARPGAGHHHPGGDVAAVCAAVASRLAVLSTTLALDRFFATRTAGIVAECLVTAYLHRLVQALVRGTTDLDPSKPRLACTTASMVALRRDTNVLQKFLDDAVGISVAFPALGAAVVLQLAVDGVFHRVAGLEHRLQIPMKLCARSGDAQLALLYILLLWRAAAPDKVGFADHHSIKSLVQALHSQLLRAGTTLPDPETLHQVHMAAFAGSSATVAWVPAHSPLRILTSALGTRRVWRMRHLISNHLRHSTAPSQRQRPSVSMPGALLASAVDDALEAVLEDEGDIAALLAQGVGSGAQEPAAAESGHAEPREASPERDTPVRQGAGRGSTSAPRRGVSFSE